MVGEYLQSVLKKKGITIKELIGRLGFKSRESIYRMFKNQYSTEKTTELAYKIMQAVPFTDEEKEKLIYMLRFYEPQIVHKNDEPSILENLYYSKEMQDSEARQECEKFLETILKKNKDGQIIIYIGKSKFEKAGDVICKFLKEYEAADIKIYHNIMFEVNDKDIERQVYIMIKLAFDKRYIGMKRNKNRNSGIIGFIRFKTVYKMFFIDENNGYAISNISEQMYMLLMKKYEKYKNGESIKYMKNHITDYADMLNEFNTIEITDSISDPGEICFCGLPADIKKILLKDANYLNLSADCDIIKNIQDAMDMREYLFLNSNASKKHIFHEDVMIEFFKKRTFSDMPIGFRSLRKEEMTATLERNFAGRRKLEYRFLKKGYILPDLSCIYINDTIMLFARNNRFDDGCFYILISEPMIMEKIKKVLYDLWENKCLSEEESRAKLEELAEKYL